MPHDNRTARPALAAAALLTSASLLAEGARGECIAANESLFGATSLNAQAGNGGLTVGVTGRGDVAVLSWPSPSYDDQIDYHTSTPPDAWDDPRLGADPNEGVFAGLAVYGPEGFLGTTWFHDGAWTASQAYAGPTSGTVVTTFWRADLGLVVEQSDLVLPGSDVWVRHFEVARDPASPVVAARLFHFVNPAPTDRRTPRYPLDDWQGDDLNDFGLVWDDAAAALLAFTPGGEAPDLSVLDPLVLGPFGTAAEQAAAVSEAWPSVRDAVGPGVWMVIAGSTPPDQVQVGADAVQRCVADDVTRTRPEDAFDDADDGELSGWTAAACQADAALGWFHSFAASGEDSFTRDVFVALAGDAESALVSLDAARGRTWEDLGEETDGYWERVVLAADLPRATAEVEAFSRRWLIAALQATDRETGAVVASVATQPPYRQDWPRDSAFIDLAFDLAGLEEAATRHALWLASVQAKVDVVDDLGNVTPRGAWAMNYYADGQIGGFVPFEIDQTGLMAWHLWEHAKHIAAADPRRQYLLAVRDAVVLAADLLSTCVDADYPAPARDGLTVAETLRSDLEAGGTPGGADEREAALQTGEYTRLLQCTANEDDDPVPARTLYGAHTVRLGLVAAAAMLDDMADLPIRAAWYRERADELAEALAGAFWDDDAWAWSGRTDWMLWPTPPLPLDDPRMVALADASLEEARAALGLEVESAWYPEKAVLTLARTFAATAPDRLAAEIAPLVDVLVSDLPTEGTLHLGETFCAQDTDGDGAADTFVNRTAQPHQWSAALAVLAARAAEDPASFDPFEGEAGWWAAGAGGTVDIQRQAVQCGCAGGGRPAGPGGAVAALAAMCLWGASRRRSG